MNQRKEEEPRVLETCEALHMMANGTMEMLEDDAVYLEKWLQRKLDAWTETPRTDSYRAVYDSTVKLLAIAALAEWRLSSFHPQWVKQAVAVSP